VFHHPPFAQENAYPAGEMKKNSRWGVLITNFGEMVSKLTAFVAGSRNFDRGGSNGIEKMDGCCWQGF